MSISAQLIKWYHREHRPLPWRETTDPYRIWLSEVILQQTRVDQGLPYYQRFVNSYPTISDLAAAPDGEVMKLWQGLGYYSRARNLLAAARMVQNEYGGVFPADYLQIRKLPGIGEYTAAAIASFAFNQPYAVVDGNVARVISRVFGIDEPVDSTKGKQIISQLANDNLDRNHPALHNQAIMEFGALLCKPAKPLCNDCFLRSQCEAYKLGVVDILPVKIKKTKTRDRFFNYLLIRHNDTIFMQKRGAKDIWQNLFELPLIETEPSIPSIQIPDTEDWKLIFGETAVHISKVFERKIHKLSHQNIYTRVFDVRIHEQPNEHFKTNFIKVTPEEAVNYAVPKVIESILEECFPVYTND